MMAGAGGLSVTNDYEFVGLVYFYFQPLFGSFFDVRGGEPFCYQALETSLLGDFVGFQSIGRKAAREQ
jgi:hypothetical protein